VASRRQGMGEVEVSNAYVVETVVLRDHLGRTLVAKRAIDPYMVRMPGWNKVVVNWLSMQEIGKYGFIEPPRVSCKLSPIDGNDDGRTLK